MLVVDDLVADVDRRAVLLEQPLDDLDRSVDAGAERARCGEEDAARSRRHRLLERVAALAVRRASSESRRRGERRPSGGGRRRSCGRRRAPSCRLPRPCCSASSEIARTTPASRPLRASTPLSMSTASAPLASRRRAPLGRIVHEHVAAENRRRARAGGRRAAALPQRLAVLVDDARRVEHVADAKPSRSEPASPNETSRASGTPFAARTPTRTVRRPSRFATRSSAVVAHGEGQPVSVHARLRTVSFRLLDASNAADGSKPEWMPQCSQRGSLPGPYDSQSMPSSSASYVGKIPSVSR